MEEELRNMRIEEADLVKRVERISLRIETERLGVETLNETDKATFTYREWRVRQMENEKQAMMIRLTKLREAIMLLAQKIKRVRNGEMS